MQYWEGSGKESRLGEPEKRTASLVVFVASSLEAVWRASPSLVRLLGVVKGLVTATKAEASPPGQSPGRCDSATGQKLKNLVNRNV